MLAELIWNGLDAEADQVDVSIETSSLGSSDRQLFYITKVTVSDNGHGLAPEIADSAFRSLGDSWKKGLNGRTQQSGQVLSRGGNTPFRIRTDDDPRRIADGPQDR